MVYIGVITHLLTIDPNFLGHPSRHPSIIEGITQILLLGCTLSIAIRSSLAKQKFSHISGGQGKYSTEWCD